MIDRLFPHPYQAGTEGGRPTPNGEVQIVSAPEAGILASIDAPGLVEAARRADAVVEVVPTVGDFVTRDSPLFRVYANDGSVSSWNGELDHLAGWVSLRIERTMDGDVAFGFRQLVDIAERALSPSVNDPTIAVHAIDHMHDLLRTLSTRSLLVDVVEDEEGRGRLVVSRPTWDDYLSLAADEVRHYGVSSVQVMRRLRAMLEDLRSVAPPERQDPIRRQLELLDRSIERHWDPEEQPIARQADQQGH